MKAVNDRLRLLQCSRRVLIIMGLVNYPELGDANIEEELSYFSRYFKKCVHLYYYQRYHYSFMNEIIFRRRHENVVLCRVFVFNNSFEIASTPLKGIKSDPESLVIFPPEGECEGGSMVCSHSTSVLGN